MSKKKIITILIIAVIFIIGVVLIRRNVFQAAFAAKENESTATAANNKVVVEVIKPKLLAEGEGTSYKATLIADQEGFVSPKNGGKVVNILFEDGKQVTQGEALVTLDDQDIKNQLKAAESQLEVAKASQQKAEVNLKNVQSSYDRTKILVEQGALAQIELDNADTALKLIKADIAASQANVQAAQTNIDILNTALADMTIRAPLTGVIGGKDVSLGQILTPGSVLGKVQDISVIDAVVDIDQALIQTIQVGQKADLKLNGDDTNIYQGVVKSINPSADSSSRAFKVKIQFENEKLSLRPGVSAKVMLVGDDKVKMFAIPVELITGKDGNYSVFINDKGIVKKQAVTIGNLISNQAEISSGLQGNEEIISTNLNMIQEGDQITVVSE